MKFFRPLADGTIQVGRIAISKCSPTAYLSRIISPQKATAIAHRKGYFTRKELGRATFVGRKIVE